MLFNSYVFLAFALIFFPIFFLLEGRLRWLWVILASYVFYGWWDYRFLGLLIASTVLDFNVGLAIERFEHDERKRRLILALSFVGNLGTLCFFKYYNFFIDTAFEAFGAWLPAGSKPTISVILPAGISFFTFQTLSYAIDVYRRDLKAERDLVKFAAFVALFPQLVAGPIVRARQLLPEIVPAWRIDWVQTGRAFELIAWGFFLKVGLGDTAATVVQGRFAAPELFGSLNHVVGVVSFSLQIYGDFAGYSLIAIGLGRIMGLDLGQNFNRPYFATSFSDFWGRWHMSLSTWFRDYVYFPLGGNRGGALFTARNLFLTMFLSGLWHGAAFTFILWGVIHGVFLATQRLVQPLYRSLCEALRLPMWLRRAVAMLVVWNLVNVAWVFFRAQSVADACLILGKIFSGEDFQIHPGQQTLSMVRTAIFAAVVLGVDALSSHDRIRNWYLSSLSVRLVGFTAVVLLLALLGTFEGASFLYFQF